MLTELVHNGVVVPDSPLFLGLSLDIKGESVALTPKQEEMAMAWAKKQGTPYVRDRTFAKNFMTDFCRQLGLRPRLPIDAVDFGPAIEIVQAERDARAQMTKEARKALAAERKIKREALREQFGYAYVNGERVPLANYVVEPSGIFMGRGRHPLRGRWKEGATHQDIVLNLSPNAPAPADPWGEIIWQPESLWVARWKDKLSAKLKYVWLSDTASIKQEREAQKFDLARDLHTELDRVRERIEGDLVDEDPKKRMIATACYLIDALCLRVGDEKDPDEADTVGATTLRPEHVTLHDDGTAEFRFLGKDSVLWNKRLELPEVVSSNLDHLIRTARPSSASQNGSGSRPTRDKPQIFPDISNVDVNSYLSGIMPSLTAKVFRTHHATIAVKESLAEAGIEVEDPEHVKWEAANLANLEAAVLCHHTKKAPASWRRSRQRFSERQAKAGQRVKMYRERVKGYREALVLLRREAREKKKVAAPARREAVRRRYDKRIEVAERRLERARVLLGKAQLAQGKIKSQSSISYRKRTWNLGTSLKSYIDPRVYYDWGCQVDYDVLEKFYPKALRLKFAWVRGEGPDEQDGGAAGADSPGGSLPAALKDPG